MAGNYGGALGDPTRFDNHRQVYRTAGLNPIQYESAGKTPRQRDQPRRQRRTAPRPDRPRHGPVAQRPRHKAYGAQLRDRGKKGGVIACAMANRANRIAYALVRDQCPYDPARWLQED